MSFTTALSGLEKQTLKEHKTKACLFNLVIDVQNTERLSYYKKVIHELIDYFPCRIFLIYFCEKCETSSLQVELISPKSSPGLVCDLVEIQLAQKHTESIKSVLLAHFVSDLPIFYLPTEHGDHLNPFTFWMASLSQKVICDSTDVVDLDSFIDNILKIYHSGVEVSDLNWSRIESWRDIIAKNLNDELISALKEIEISYCIRPEVKGQLPFQGYYLKEFLASRLEKIGLHIPVKLKAVNETKIWPGAILTVHFLGKETMQQVFLRNLIKPEEAIIHFESSTECFLPAYVQFTKTETGQSLVKEIKHGQSSVVYVEVLERIKASQASKT